MTLLYDGFYLRFSARIDKPGDATQQQAKMNVA